ncbi:MAG: DUF1003 domain-containing protein [Bacilli bacterium]|nr:DUF1003 domain-containing protein [Bacilli bacterium]
MEKNRKKEIVKMLVNTDLDVSDEEQMMQLLFDQNLAVDVDKQEEENETKSDKLADKITAVAGSWRFIIGFILFLTTWVVFNLIVEDIDPYPFTFLNLLLSCIAALQAPIIMMSQNRAAKKDSLRSKNDYKVDLKSELILEQLHDEIRQIINNQNKIIKIIKNKKTR